MDRARDIYFNVLAALTMAIVLASFVRERAQLFLDIGLWLFAASFVASVISLRIGLLLGTLLLTVSPSLHHQINALAGTNLNAWAYAGADGLIGFLAAWLLKGGLKSVRPALRSFPAGPILALHLWIALSATIAVGRNVWQSASEVTLRGLAYNVWLTRGLSFHDDYFPVQELFFYSVAVIALFGAWAMLTRYGESLLRSVAATVIVGAIINTLFAAWQKSTGRGWFADSPLDINSLWADIHSFGSLTAIAIALGFGFVLARRLSLSQMATVGVAIALAALGLYLSGSRSTLLIVCLLLVVSAAWAATRLRGLWRLFPLALVLLMLAILDWTFTIGYRGVSFSTLEAAFESMSFKALNAELRHRPEIWRAAFEMYSNFPVFGLGQGAFHRLSSIAQFSGSEVLVGMRGGGAHNYFVQTFVELGLVGLGLVALTSVPFIRLGRENLRLISFYALAGVAIGNLYGHSLLVREMLMLASIFAGAYIWEAKTIGAGHWRPPASTTARFASVALIALALAAFVEVAASFNRLPFTYGQRCFEAHPLQYDGWTLGNLKVAVPSAADVARLTIVPGTHDIARRALDLELAVVDAKGGPLLQESIRFERGDEGRRQINVPLTAVDDAMRFLELKPSHCYVPLNLGYSLNAKHETRRLGVLVTELRFMDANGIEVR